jgi:hypothetical protein
MEFKATLDMKTNIITAIVIMILLGIAYFLPHWATQEGEPNQLIIFGLPLFNILIILLAYYFSVKSYLVDNQFITIKRPFTNVKINRQEIANISAIELEAMKGALRLFGSSGVFGYYGIFRNSTLKNFTMYGTQTENYILIELQNGKKIVLTPDEPEAFLNATNSI